MKTIILSFIFFIMFAGSAFSAGETFKVETTGTEYCGDFDYSNFNSKNNVDFWFKITSGQEIMVSFTSNFQAGTTFPVSTTSFMTGKTKAAFVGGVLFEDGSWLSMFGKSTLDKYGEVKSVQGTFSQDSLIYAGCFSSGTFKTVAIK